MIFCPLALCLLTYDCSNKLMSKYLAPLFLFSALDGTELMLAMTAPDEACEGCSIEPDYPNLVLSNGTFNITDRVVHPIVPFSM